MKNQYLKSNKPDFDGFYDDALAYLKHCQERKVDPAQILNTLIHDISGIVRQEKCFVPRVSGWARAMKPQRGKK